MGSYNATYIGVYLKVAYSKCEQETITLVNSEGKVFKSGSFDPDTGEKLIEKVSKTYKMVRPDVYIDDVDDLYEDEFHSPMYTDSSTHAYFLINSETRFGKHLEPYSTFNVDVNVLDIGEIIEKFKKEYSAYLHHYSVVCGYEVEVKWGVINYGN